MFAGRVAARHTGLRHAGHIAWPGSPPDPRIAVRVVEVEQVTAVGEHRYAVAVDVDATPLA
jgi:hypothetical protein